jgi:hypothetical protein
MSNPGPLLAGFDYQHLYSWWLILGLKLPDEKVQKIIVENGQAGYVDDVTAHSEPDNITINYEPGTTSPDRFYQIKYHVNHRDTYSSKNLIQATHGHKSLLEKFWFTWKQLRQETPGRVVELYLISNWAWAGKDVLGAWVSGNTDRIKANEFMAEKLDSPVGKVRTEWQQKLNASDKEFDEFINSLHFRLGYSASVLSDDLVTERMKRLNMRTDPAILKVVVGIVRAWIISNQREITPNILEAELQRYNCYLPVEEERCIVIHMETIVKIKPNREPDHLLDWVDEFVDKNEKEKGHQLHNPDNWNAKLLPHLRQLKEQVALETTCMLIRVGGRSRISAWFAFGYTFSGVAGYTIEIDIPRQNWRTDADENKDFALVVTSNGDGFNGEILSGTGDTIALGICFDTSLDEDVRRYLKQQNENVAALLLLRAEPDILRDAGDAVALARKVKRYASIFTKYWDANRILLFYNGPASGACFIGHKLNKICRREVQIMEHQPHGDALYAPSFLFTM